jgi:hypothetical protein
MPVNQTSGNLTTDAFGGGVAAVSNYIEDVFSTYLYTGNGTSQTITNNIDLSTKGGLVWIKSRSAAELNCAFDTARGVYKYLFVNTTNAQPNYGAVGVTAFNTNGFGLTGGSGYEINTSAETYASWTFRKQPKFFDVVTYTGNSSVQNIAHNLGSVPGCIIIKCTTTAFAWCVYHSSLGNTKSLELDSTAAADTSSTYWNNTSPTSTQFTLGSNTRVNGSGTYVAYIFADNAGGFGLTGTDNVISCGSLVGNGTYIDPVTLGYEPQFVILKRADGSGSWTINDNMRGMATQGGQIARLYPNLSNAEEVATFGAHPTATGFVATNLLSSGETWIYIAIRRGPMKVPTDATKVFKPIFDSNVADTVETTGFVVDSQWLNYTPGTASNSVFSDRLRGVNTIVNNATPYLSSSSTNAEVSATDFTNKWSNTGFSIPGNYGGSTTIYWNFGRAPSFFDEVCWTGSGSGTQTLAHNLGVVPELMIVKKRSATSDWNVYSSATGATNTLFLNTTAASSSASFFANTTPTSSNFYIGGGPGGTWVTYLFATCAGVSKVGSYTGNGTTQTINCGFTGGARFVLIKRTDSTGGWYVYDTARGMTTLTDPYLLLNSAAAETATLGSVTTVSTGFAVNATILAAINTSSATYIFLAIA